MSACSDCTKELCQKTAPWNPNTGSAEASLRLFATIGECLHKLGEIVGGSVHKSPKLYPLLCVTDFGTRDLSKACNLVLQILSSFEQTCITRCLSLYLQNRKEEASKEKPSVTPKPNLQIQQPAAAATHKDPNSPIESVSKPRNPNQMRKLHQLLFKPQNKQTSAPIQKRNESVTNKLIGSPPSKKRPLEHASTSPSKRQKL